MSKELELLRDVGYAWQVFSGGLRAALLPKFPHEDVIDAVLADVKPIFHAAWNENWCEIVSLDSDDDADRANASIVKIVMYLLIEVARARVELMAGREYVAGIHQTAEGRPVE